MIAGTTRAIYQDYTFVNQIDKRNVHRIVYSKINDCFYLVTMYHKLVGAPDDTFKQIFRHKSQQQNHVLGEVVNRRSGTVDEYFDLCIQFENFHEVSRENDAWLDAAGRVEDEKE